MRLHVEAERKKYQEDQRFKAFLEEERKTIAAEERLKVQAELKKAAEEKRQTIAEEEKQKAAAAAEAEKQKAEAERAAEEERQKAAAVAEAEKGRRPEEKGGEKGKGKGEWKRPYNPSQGGLQSSQFRDKMRKLCYENCPGVRVPGHALQCGLGPEWPEPAPGLFCYV